MREEPTLIRFDRRETGWAVPDPSGHWRIANIPLADDVNIDDLVELTRPCKDRPRRIRRILERPFPGKALLHYPDLRAVHRLTAVLTEHGCRCEAFFRPAAGHPGVLAVAHPETLDPVQVAEAMGYPQP